MPLPYITPVDVQGRSRLWQLRWDLAAAYDQQGGVLSTLNCLLETSTLWVGVCSLQQIGLLASDVQLSTVFRYVFPA